jgi:DNA-binding GntR family transcriptional regulator
MKEIMICMMGDVFMNNPIERVEPLVDQVYSYLRQEILTGKIDPGSRIVETKIAKQLSISRSPVREAIRRLEQEGLIINDKGVTTLFEPSKSDFEDLYELRLAIEPMAARLAASHMPEEDLDVLKDILRKTDECLANGEIDQFIECNTQFHSLIVDGSGNRRLQKVIHETAVLCRYYRYIAFKIYQRRVTSVEEHWKIYHALRKRDSKAAWQCMMDHLEGDLSYIQSIGQQEGK